MRRGRTGVLAAVTAAVLVLDVGVVHAAVRHGSSTAATDLTTVAAASAVVPAAVVPAPVVVEDSAPEPSPAAVASPAPSPLSGLAVSTSTTTVTDGPRTLVTTVYAPTEAGAFPLVVFVHGWDSSPAVYDGLLRAWASAGYVVAAPTFPYTNRSNAVDEGDMINEPADVSAVITTMLAEPNVDSAAGVGVAGHSDGAMVALAVGYASAYGDPRVTTVEVLEGAADSATFGAYDDEPAALLVAQSDTDEYNAEGSGLRAYAVDAGGTRALLQLTGTSHLGPYSATAAGASDAARSLVAAATTAWWDLHLSSRTTTTASLLASGTAAGLSSVQLG